MCVLDLYKQVVPILKTMRTLFLIIFILASGMSSYGQIDKSEFYGSWTVKRVLEKPSDPDFEPLIDGF